MSRGTVGVHTTGSIASALGAELVGPPDIEVKRLDTLRLAGPGEMTFIRDEQNAREWQAARASAALVSRGVPVVGHDPASKALLVVPDADLAVIAALELLAPPPPPRAPGIHPTAVVDPGAKVDPTAHVGPHCVVESGAAVGPGAVLVARVHVGHGASIGARTTLHAGVAVLDRCVIGNACTLHAGVVIGADGFGYRPDPKTGAPVKIPHIGIVTIGNAVEIGANSTIDRAKFGATVIGDGTKIDNLVQIGHNCHVGRCCIICGQAGLAGSVTVADGAMIGGAASIRDNLTIGPRAQIAGRSGVMRDIEPGEAVFGYPAVPAREAFRSIAAIRNLRSLFARVRTLERAVLGKTDESDPG